MLASSNPHIRTGPGTPATQGFLKFWIHFFHIPCPKGSQRSHIFIISQSEGAWRFRDPSIKKCERSEKMGETWGNKEIGDISDRWTMMIMMKCRYQLAESLSAHSLSKKICYGSKTEEIAKHKGQKLTIMNQVHQNTNVHQNTTFCPIWYWTLLNHPIFSFDPFPNAMPVSKARFSTIFRHRFCALGAPTEPRPF